MLTQILDEFIMPDISPHLALNKSIGTYIERIRLELQSQQVSLHDAKKLAVPTPYITNAIAVSSAIERLATDLLARDNTVDMEKYSDLYDADSNNHRYLSVYVSDETIEAMGRVARLIDSQFPKVSIHWRGKINVKKLASIAVYYVDDIYA